MERRLKLSAFRNIGFKNDKPSFEGIVLNHSIKKENLGDLVILIGPNNSGKSNVLDAITKLGHRLDKRDITNIYMEKENRNPSLSLVYNDDDSQYSFSMDVNNQCIVNYPNSIPNKFVTKSNHLSIDSIPTIINEINRIISLENNFLPESQRKVTSLYTKSPITTGMEENAFNEFVKNYISIIAEYLTKYSIYQQIIDNRNNQTPIFKQVVTEFENYVALVKESNSPEGLRKAFAAKYGYDFFPKQLVYTQQNITNKNLETTYSDMKNSNFMLAVLKAIDINPDTVLNAYTEFTNTRNIGILQTTARKLNKALKSVTKRFNQLYYLDDASYSFEFVLESERIFFSLYRGEQSISLDYQSTGFRWFFDLYFNLFSSTILNPGDIVIMDEPATNLHVKGQIELRKFLKEFAMKNNITLVIATHSPFLIDLDYLDELRIVSNKDGISTIDNDFSAVDADDPDSLRPIKESLTCENHILLDPDQRVVFVEGITDYNYLTAMKKVLGYENITFLPIHGLGKKGQEKEISKKLISIRKHDAFLLADGDAAGNAMKNANKESDLTVMLLSEVDEKFKEIENLFDAEDAKKYGLIDATNKPIKHNSTSSVFKNLVVAKPDGVSQKTKENFKKLFERIID